MDGMIEDRRRAGQIPFTVPAVTKVQVLPPDESRLFLQIKNTGAAVCNVAFDQDATESNGYPMAAGEVITFPNADSVIFAYVTAYSVGGSSLYIITNSRMAL